MLHLSRIIEEQPMLKIGFVIELDRGTNIAMTRE